MMTKGEGYASKNTIYTLSRGTKRLQRLINQLMEFRKINTGNMKLFSVEARLCFQGRYGHRSLYGA
ncbi:Uncharacterised protein [Segatella copri]|nr:Uncharacterised protein [Segatella copri]